MRWSVLVALVLFLSAPARGQESRSLDVGLEPCPLDDGRPAFELPSEWRAEETAILAAVAESWCPRALLDPRLADHPTDIHGPRPGLARRRLSHEAIGELLGGGCLSGLLDPSGPRLRNSSTFALSVPVLLADGEVEVVTLACGFGCRSMAFHLVRGPDGWSVAHEERRWIE